MPVFALLAAGITFSTYLFAILIFKAKDDNRKKKFMQASIILVLLPLFLFKYYSTVNTLILNWLTAYHIWWPLPEIQLMLPIGISFYTFMAIGYTIDVYNEEIVPEENLGVFALFLSFFPLILSGPIERAKNMIPQFRTNNRIEYTSVVNGLKMMLWGYFMKLVVADRLGIYIDTVTSNFTQHNGTTLIFAYVLYPFQLYADLGGYSLIAIGTSKVLGFNIIPNFKRPFFSTSISEFWRRWHISLISWLTDYIYTPLSFAFRKYKVWGIIMALMVTFFISGIWHGAALTFICWGILQGLFLSAEALTNQHRSAFEKKYRLASKAWYQFTAISLTFLVFAASQIFGRAPNINDAFQTFIKIFATSGKIFIGSPSTLIFGLLGLSVLMIKDFTNEFLPNRFLFLESQNKVKRYLAYSTIFILILLMGVFDGGQFIYFQF